MMNPHAHPETPEAPDLYAGPIEQWLLAAVRRTTGCRVVIDNTAAHPCSVDPESGVICIRANLTIDELLHVLPRAALFVTFGEQVEHLGITRFPLRLIHGGNAKAS